MENSIELLIRLIFAHILCDFIFQNKRMVDKKQSDNNIQKYSAITIHSLTHSICSYIILMEWQYWSVPLIVFISHFTIDSLKSNCKNKGLLIFSIDQILHLLTIVVMWAIIFNTSSPSSLKLDDVLSSQNILILTAYLLVLKPASIILSLFFNRWNIESNMKGLPNAGKWIGYFERILIITSILTSQAEMIGFLIAAKSIFRFGELKHANEIKVTEYILIGTFASFTYAIVVGYMAKFLLG
ncbi:MAG: DUF3307 domain-containing protein [Rikenellaceae bacterium]